MGANATTFVPTYVAGEVLTAADLNVTNSGIPVFADTTARDAAFGGTGEKVLAEGQFAYIETGNITQYYDGASWVSVGVSGLTLISSTNLATGTTSVNNAFSATYMNYMIVLSNASASAQASLSFKFRASGTDSSTGYYAVGIEPTYSAGTYASRTANNATAVLAPIVQIQTTEKSGGTMFVQQPFEATTTSYQYLAADHNTARGPCNGSGYHNVATSYDGFSLILSTGTWSTGTVKVYGLANS